MYNLSKSKKLTTNPKLKWSICPNHDCDCSFFSKDIIFTTSDLIRPLFFKDNSDNIPICYCSDLTRGEIKNPVRNGCKTIDKVQNYTKKNITGFCEEKNSSGKCCRNVFLKTIRNGIK